MNEIIKRPETSPTDLKICPHCKGQIHRDANICMFCGETLSTVRGTFTDDGYDSYQYEEVQFDDFHYDDRHYKKLRKETPVDFTSDTKYCKFCGGQIHIDAIVCTLCGRQVEDFRPNVMEQTSGVPVPPPPPNPMPPDTSPNLKNRLASMALCLTTGFVGGHKFYEGKIVMGILRILLFVIFCASMEEFDDFVAGMTAIGSIAWCVADFIILCTKPKLYDPKAGSRSDSRRKRLK